MTINFANKISLERPYSHKMSSPAKTEQQINRRCESDRGRIINSAAIRRLQQKTQVFPLERNASVRSRLTHSLEVQQTGRYIVRTVLDLLKKKGGLACYGLAHFERAAESLVEMACLLHDIGNPPFGHFGESAINDWFKEHLPAMLDDSEPDQQGKHQHFCQLNRMMHTDLCHFEGNAQAIRLVHTLLQLNLTYAQVACILKYTAPAWWTGDKPANYSALMKKPGFYLSERDYIDKLKAATGLQDYHRFPLTYIMEAADDISYCIADLDDAVEKHIFSVPVLYEYLKSGWAQHRDNDLFDKTIEKAWQESQTNRRRSCSDQFFMSLRVNVQTVLVSYSAKRFTDNLPAIFDGYFNAGLLDDGGEEGRLLGLLKSIARLYVFCDSEVEQVELQGYRVIRGLLDAYQPMLALNGSEFEQLAREGQSQANPIVTRLYHRLPPKHCNAYLQQLDALSCDDPIERGLWEKYFRYRLIQDYISGMTDVFAWEEYRRLMAVDFV